MYMKVRWYNGCQAQEVFVRLHLVYFSEHKRKGVRRRRF